MPLRRSRRLRRIPASLLTVALATITAVVFTTVPAQAATITVTQAISTQNGSVATVRGYVVGQPTATSTVVTDSYPNDYALALAAAPSETDTADMLYVQVPSAFRSTWGLRSNPDLVGQQIDVTGTLAAYFSHPGHKNGTTFALANGGTPEEPTPTDPPTNGEIPSGYYDDASGKSGDQLKTALNGIIDNHTTLSYDQVWDALKAVDEDPNNANNVITVYSQLSLPKSSNGGDADQWNREHTWAKSHGDFGTSAGPGTDVHHLMPEDVTVNSTRGNLDFDETTGSVDQCSGCAVDGDSFEPPAVTRGDIARAMFYMAVRYEGTDAYVDLEVNDQVGNGSAPYIGKLSVLKAWHEADPPSEFEINRNDEIYADWQHNRNPFVDHPEWVESIW